MTTTSQVVPTSRIKMARIAVLTDFSRAADTALRYAAAFAGRYNADIVLAHAYTFPRSAFAAPEISLTLEAMEELHHELQERLVTLTKSRFLENVQCSIVLSLGGSKDLLNDLKSVDLIVVGTTGESGIGKAAFGSTAEAIFRSSSAPVLTVGPHCQCDDARVFSINTVLYATDFSDGATNALPYALSVAEKYEAEFVLLHVIDDKELPFSFERVMASQEPLEKLQQLVSDYKTTSVVAFGTPAKMILAEARKRKADIIVGGARGAGTFASAVSHFSGGTAYQIAAIAECPVLTVRME